MQVTEKKAALFFANECRHRHYDSRSGRNSSTLMCAAASDKHAAREHDCQRTWTHGHLYFAARQEDINTEKLQTGTGPTARSVAVQC